MAIKEESHMIQHQQRAHKDMKSPVFNFRVVKSFKTRLERQIGEAIRIQSRGNVLNQRGEFNRESKEEESAEDEMSLLNSNKSKSKGRGPVANLKRRKVEDEEGHVWGEPLLGEDEARVEFLRSGEEQKHIKPSTQSKLVVLLGVEWWAHELVKGLINSAASLAKDMDDMKKWKEWTVDESAKPRVEEQKQPKSSGRTIKKKEETSIYPKVKKRGKVVADQPSIATIFRKISEAKLSEAQPKACIELKDGMNNTVTL